MRPEEKLARARGVITEATRNHYEGMGAHGAPILARLKKETTARAAAARHLRSHEADGLAMLLDYYGVKGRTEAERYRKLALRLARDHVPYFQTPREAATVWTLTARRNLLALAAGLVKTEFGGQRGERMPRGVFPMIECRYYDLLPGGTYRARRGLRNKHAEAVGDDRAKAAADIVLDEWERAVKNKPRGVRMSVLVDLLRRTMDGGS